MFDTHFISVLLRSLSNKGLIFTALMIFAVHASIFAQLNIGRVEYYIDTDPGFGNATSLPISTGIDLANLTIPVNTASLSEGVHRLYVRASSANGWGMTNTLLFYKPIILGSAGSGTTAPNISRLEYYIDTDPGFGNATSITIGTGTDLANLIIPLNTVAISEGVHRLYVRAASNNGWSLTNTLLFYKPISVGGAGTGTTAPNISRIEYYLDIDPGFGNATSLPISQGTDLTDLIIPINPDTLGQGVHRLYVRAASANGWSLTNTLVFYKPITVGGGGTSTTAPNISRVEYYLDSDPGIGNGISVPFTPATNITDLSFIANISSLSLGDHHINIRAQDANGSWSLVNSSVFKVLPPDSLYIKSESILSSLVCAGSTIKIPYGTNAVFNTGNVFSAQLSDSSGNFSNPISIGSSNSTIGDTINAEIPSNIPFGKNYKIRITSTLPLDTSSTVPLTFIQPVTITSSYTGCNSLVYLGINYTENTVLRDTLKTSKGCDSVYKFVNINIFYDPAILNTIPTLTNTGRLLIASTSATFSTYQWYKDGITIGGARVNSYTAIDAGIYTVSFISNCGASPRSNPINFGGNAQSQTIEFSTIVDKTYGDFGFPLQATASSGLPITYTIINGPARIAGDSLYINGAGNVTIQASQVGSINYLPATSVNQTITIAKANQLVSLDSISNKLFGDSPFTINGSSSTGLPLTYTVVNGLASIQGNVISLNGAGTITIRATQQGNQNYSSAFFDRIFCVQPQKPNKIFGFIESCISSQQYYIDSIPGAIYTWSVSEGGNISKKNGGKATVNWTSVGLHKLYVTVNNICNPANDETTELPVNIVTSAIPADVTNIFPLAETLVSTFPFSLSWKTSSLTQRYDVYIWPEGSIQPDKPYKENLETVALILTNGSDLPAFSPGNKYFWKVVSRNACSYSSGVTSSFIITQLPNLILQSVDFPDTAFSGKSIDITIKVLNNGRVPTRNISWITSGNSSYSAGEAIRWTDAVYLSRDTIFNPAFDLLIGSSANLSALDSGQQYLNTFKLTLPQNTIGDYHLITITNAFNSLTEETRIDDTIVSPILINLTPPPDLQVTSVITPLEAFSAQRINITYTVKNKGSGQTTAFKWQDNIYISPDEVFDRNTAFKLDEISHVQGSALTLGGPFQLTHLLPDSSYTKNFTVTLPSKFFGTHYIFIETDVLNNEYEFTFENNNTNRNEVIQIFLTPPPDFVVKQFAAPAALSSEEIVSLNYTIQNIGATAPLGSDRKWLDGIYISRDSVFNIKNAQLLDFTLPFARVIEIICGVQAGASSIGSGNSSSSGGSNLTVGYAFGGVGNFGDVVVKEYCDIPSGLNDKSYTRVSEDGYIKEVTCSQTLTYAKMLPEEFYNYKINAILPDSLAGTYYLHLYTDLTNQVFEFQQENNNTTSSKIEIFNPDLIVDNFAGPDTVSSGTNLNFSWLIKNQGQGKVFVKNRKDMIWLSRSSVYDTLNMIRVDSLTYCTAIENNASITKQKMIKIPDGLSGIYYLFVSTDLNRSIYEGTQDGNNYIAKPLYINLSPSADLRFNTIQLSKDTVEFDEAFNIIYNASNNGNNDISGRNWIDSIYISSIRDEIFDSSKGHAISGVLRTQPLGINANYGVTKSIKIDQSVFDTYFNQIPRDSTFYVYSYIDGNNNIYEHNAENNNTGRVKLTVRNVDLAVTKVSSPVNVNSGKISTLDWTVLNKGGKTGLFSSNWLDFAYLSLDTLLDPSDTLILKIANTQPVISGGTYNKAINYKVPDGFSGNYYILVVTDSINSVKDSYLPNNINTMRDQNGIPIPINISLTPSPDLIVNSFSIPAIGYSGQPFTIKWQVKNTGVGPTNTRGWTDRVFLTTSQIKQFGDKVDGILIGTYQRKGDLNVNESYSDSLDVFIPMVLSGNYNILIITDNPSRVYEQNGESNNGELSPILIIKPLPSDIIAKDILIPSQVLISDSIDVTWSIKNIGANPAEGYFAQGVYLSQDSAWSIDDVLLLNPIEKNIYLSPLAEIKFNRRIKVKDVKDSKYFLIIRSDLTNNIVESDEKNNTGVSNETINVSILNLPINLLTPNLLVSKNELYYKLEIPDSLKGETMLISLKSNTLITPNELYLKLGDVPTRASFDYGYESANSGNQEILIPALSKGSYYILVFNNASVNAQNISLLAQKISFSIRNVKTDEGGNTGLVTTKIRGAKFEPGMQVSLQNSTLGTIVAINVQYVNSTTIFATFNLGGKSVGVYNVIAKKSNNDTTSLPDAFTILKGSGGGFQGGGTTPGGTSSGGFYCTIKNIGVDELIGIDVQSPSSVRWGSYFKMEINFGNSGNVDVPMPGRLLVSLSNMPISLSQENLLSDYKRELFLEFKEVNGPVGVLRPGATGSITIYTFAAGGGWLNFRLIE